MVEPLSARVLGRTVAEEVYDSDGKTVLVEAGTMLDEAWVDGLDNLGVDELIVRSCSTG